MYDSLFSAAYSLRPTGRYLKALARTQWLNREEIQVYQLKKLRSMLDHCYRTVPFYHKAMKKARIHPQDIRNFEDLGDLPAVGKAHHATHPEQFRSRGRVGRVFKDRSSGSMGQPLRFLKSRKSWEWQTASWLRFCAWGGFRLGMKWANLRRIDVVPKVTERFGEAVTDALWRRLRVNDFKVAVEEMMNEAKRIISFEPFLVFSVPKSLLEFGRFADDGDVSVPFVLSTGEALSSYERQLVSDRWGAEVFDMYGLREARCIAAECAEHSGLHVSDELYLLEYVKDGEQVSPGERGRILVTSLCSWAQPFIRYDTGDVSTAMDEACSCGRGLSLTSPVDGREVDVIETEEGKLIFGVSFFDWFADVYVRQYQVEQHSRTRISIRIVPEDGYGEEFGQVVARRVMRTLGPNVEVSIQAVDAIPDYASGKRQLVKSTVRFPGVN